MNLKFKFEHRLKYFPTIITALLDIDGVYLAGGALRAYINNEVIEDYDFFFTSDKSMEECKERCLEFKFKIKFQCPENKLVTLKHKNIKIQLCNDTPFLDPMLLIGTFDFTCTQFITDGKFLWTTSQAIRHTKKRELHLNLIPYPAATLGRFYKYQKRGYRLGEDTKVDFVNRLILSSPEIVNHQRVYID